MAIQTHSMSGESEREFLIRAGARYKIENVTRLRIREEQHSDPREFTVMITLQEIVD
jgi:hypothetical protein